MFTCSTIYNVIQLYYHACVLHDVHDCMRVPGTLNLVLVPRYCSSVGAVQLFVGIHTSTQQVQLLVKTIIKKGGYSSTSER